MKGQTEAELAEQIRACLAAQPAMTGAELLAVVGADPLAAWRACRRAPGLIAQAFGRRYLRLDRAVPDYARLSPSIRRAFQTYTVFSPADQAATARARAAELAERARDISRAKRILLQQTVQTALAKCGAGRALQARCLFLLAGDIVYDMAHDVPRPEPSTGQCVRGSDLDLVVVTPDDLPADDAAELDQRLYDQKHLLLRHPDYREELDFLVKPLARVREQFELSDFESWVACKIMGESVRLLGSAALEETVRAGLTAAKIPARLAALEALAAARRLEAEEALLKPERPHDQPDVLHLFYTREEREEIY